MHDSTTKPRYWIWPVRLSNRSARSLDIACRRQSEWQTKNARWLFLSILAGVCPVLVAYAMMMPVDRILTMMLLVPLLIGAVRSDSMVQGIGILLATFATHSIAVIWLTSLHPNEMAELLPFGEAYWKETSQWIVTGENPEYRFSNWVPAHLQALLGVPVASFLTFGGVLASQGLYQLDMMNVYVGNLLNVSVNPLIAVGLGWHPWSVMRGIGFLLLGLEAVSWSLSRFLRVSLSTNRRRTIRWAVGIGFLMIDATVKLTTMELVRSILKSNLIEAEL